MGIIYMDFYYNRRDDMILSMSPLVLLFFITQVDDVLKYLIVAMIISNVTYWNCKNIYTFTLDSLFATTFIAYLFYKCMKLEQNMYVLVALLLVILYYFRASYIKGRKGERQLYEHLQLPTRLQLQPTTSATSYIYTIIYYLQILLF